MASEPKFVPSQPKAGIFQRFRRSGFALVPFVVWAGGIAGVLYLAQQQARPLDYPGMASVQRFAIAAPAPGKLETLLVAKRDVVVPGQLIGRLDGAHLEVRARTVANRVAEIRAEIARERALHDKDLARDQVEQDNEFRRFQRDVENARLNSLAVLATLEENRIRIEGLRIDLERQKALSTQELFSEAELIRTRTEVAALDERIEQTEAILRSRNAKLVAVEARLSDYEKRKKLEGADMDAVLGTYQWRIAAQDDELEMIALLRKRLEIRVTAGGLVDEVRARAGDVVTEGRTLITIIDPAPSGVIAYLPAAEVKNVKIGMPAILERSTDPRRLIKTRVTSIGSTIVELPPQTAAFPSVRQWGMPVFLEMTPEMEAIPGETIRVRLLTDG